MNPDLAVYSKSEEDSVISIHNNRVCFPKMSCSWGRNWEWCAGGTLGCVGLIAVAVSGTPVVVSLGLGSTIFWGGLGGTILIICCLGGRISWIKPERDFEDNTENFVEGVGEFTEDVEGIKNENILLQTTVADIQTKLEEAEELIVELESTLDEKTRSIAKSTKELKDVVIEFNKLPGVTEEIGKSTLQNKSIVGKLQELVPIITNLFKGFSSNVKELDVHEDELSSENRELEDNLVSLKVENKKLNDAVKDLTERLNKALARIAELDNEIGELKKNTAVIKDTGDTVEEATGGIREDNTKEQKTLDEIKEKLGNINVEGPSDSES